MIPAALSYPPAEYSLMPFWFWNDDLKADELLRQMDDFQQHGVDGFVIHPRLGLPRQLGWMSEGLLAFYRLVIEEARRRAMKVLLYDEGMYPSGSASGQVVAKNPDFACRCLAKVDLPASASPPLKPGENPVADLRRQDGARLLVVDRPAHSVIRGLHYLGEGPAEEQPPAGDILNPQAVANFIQLVYDQFAAHFEPFFGDPIVGIFTDEPGLLGRDPTPGVLPGTTGILAQVNRILGYDFTPHLPALWYDDEPEAARYRRDYQRAINLRLTVCWISWQLSCPVWGSPVAAWPCTRYQDTAHPLDGTRLTLAFDQQDRSLLLEGQVFNPSSRPVPPALPEFSGIDNLIVHSLHLGNERLGFLIVDASSFEGSSHQDVIHSASPGAFLMEIYSPACEHPRNFGVTIHGDPQHDLAIYFDYDVESGMDEQTASQLHRRGQPLPRWIEQFIHELRE
jgi:hypothetical protein